MKMIISCIQNLDWDKLLFKTNLLSLTKDPFSGDENILYDSVAN